MVGLLVGGRAAVGGSCGFHFWWTDRVGGMVGRFGNRLGWDAGTAGMDGIGFGTSNPSYWERELEDGFDTGWVHTLLWKRREDDSTAVAWA